MGDALEQIYRECRRVQREKVVGPSEYHGSPREHKVWERSRYHTAKDLAEFVRKLMQQEAGRAALREREEG